MDDQELNKKALDYHCYPQPGKIATALTKPSENQYDLALAYSPGVAEPCRLIHRNPNMVYEYTQKANLVAVISNGTAVLGLGDIGPLASKPVMEGKVFLFKRFGNVDGFDIEIAERDPEKFVEIVVAIAPTFGGINLEDIAAPACFYIEKELQKRLSIPVFHDDQHGTAIVLTAALKNALFLQNKCFSSIKVVAVGAGAAGLASLEMLIRYGVLKENIYLFDSKGLIHTQRSDLSLEKQEFAQSQNLTLAEALIEADVFIGLSKGGLLNSDMIQHMAYNAIVFAMANPIPEIFPEEVQKIREDIIVATGRSDYPNQVNNLLCFPYIFRGALDVRAKQISVEMKDAAVRAIAQLAREPVDPSLLKAYNLEALSFGKNYILPKPLDPRLQRVVSSAVSAAAIASGDAKYFGAQTQFALECEALS